MADIDYLDVAFSFKSRPSDLPPDLRPNWRVPLLLLMLHVCCRGGKSTLFRLHVLNWSSRNQENQNKLLANLASDLEYSEVPIRVEPAFVRTIQFAVAEGLVSRVGGDRVQLTDSGKAFANQLVENGAPLGAEREFLRVVGQRLTENWVEGFSKWGRAR
jgi:hypothetical protein